MSRTAYSVPVRDGAALAWLYAHGEVVERVDGEENVAVTVRLLPADRARFESQHVPARAENGGMES